MTSTIADEQLAALEGFAGALLRPGEEGYEGARHAYNGLIDKRPALIARCHGEADIVAAVGFAGESGLEASVRGGGHNVAGRCLVEDGIMIDLSAMKGIFVDPAGRTARVQPGVSWAELNRETQLHGLAVTGGVISTTGVGTPAYVHPGDQKVESAIHPSGDAGPRRLRARSALPHYLPNVGTNDRPTAGRRQAAGFEDALNGARR
jgi:hypothetical protein